MRRVLVPFWAARWRLLLRLLYPPAGRWRQQLPLPMQVAAMVEWAAVGALGTMVAPGRVTARHRAWARQVLRRERERQERWEAAALAEGWVEIKA